MSAKTGESPPLAPAFAAGTPSPSRCPGPPAHQRALRRDRSFCLLRNVIPRDEVPAVREGFLRARAAHQAATAALNEAFPPPQTPEATQQAIESGLAEIQETLTDPGTTRTEAIALVDALAARLREQGISSTNGPLGGQGGRNAGKAAPLPTHEISYFPEFSAHIANPLLLSVVRNVLDPHARVYQVEFGKTLPGGNKNTDSRGWHTDPPHDLSYAPGAVAQPFPNVCMSLVTVWYLSDVDATNGGTVRPAPPPCFLPVSLPLKGCPRSLCCLVRTATRETRAGRSTALIRESLSPESSKSSPRRAACSFRTPACSTAVRPLTQLPFGLPSAPAPFSYSYPLSRAVAANPSDSDRVGCVVRYAPFCSGWSFGSMR